MKVIKKILRFFLLIIIIVLFLVLFNLIKTRDLRGTFVFSDSIDIYVSSIKYINQWQNFRKDVKYLYRFPVLSCNGRKLAFVTIELIGTKYDNYYLHTLKIVEKTKGYFGEYKYFQQYKTIYESEKSKEEIGHIAWSPDGKKLCYLNTERNAAGKLIWKIRILDLSKGQVIKTIAPDMLDRSDTLSWSADGRYIYFSITDFYAFKDTIMRYDILNDKIETITEGINPQCSPVDNLMIYLKPVHAFGQDKIYISDLDGRNERVVAQGYESSTSLVWSPDGKHFLYRKPNKNPLYAFGMQTYDLVAVSVKNPNRKVGLAKISSCFGMSWSQ